MKTISTILLVAALVIPVLAIAKPNSSIAPLEVSSQTQWKEVVSGRYWQMPRSAWLDEGLMPVKYVQIHWFLEVNDVRKIEPEKYDTPVKKYVIWEKIRKEILDAFVEEKLLTKRKGSSASFPKEIYDDREWSRTVKQALAYRYGYSIDFCNVRLVVHSLKHKGSVEGDLRWWDERIINLSNGNCRS